VTFDEETDIVGGPICNHFEAMYSYLDVEVDGSKKASLPICRR
jgi:hypothetical protein